MALSVRLKIGLIAVGVCFFFSVSAKAQMSIDKALERAKFESSKQAPCQHCINGIEYEKTGLDDLAVKAFIWLGISEPNSDQAQKVLDLAAAYHRAGRMEDAAIVFTLCDKAGMVMDSAQFVRFIDALDLSGQPFQAAQRMELAIHRGEIEGGAKQKFKLAELYRTARSTDRSIRVLDMITPEELSHSPEFAHKISRNYISEGQCAKAEKTMRHAPRSERSDEIWLALGECYASLMGATETPSCWVDDEEVKETDWYRINRNARRHFVKIPPDRRKEIRADKWITFLDATLQAREDRCRFERSDPHISVCESQWVQAYARQAYNGGEPTVNDEYCKNQKERYDEKYRRVK